MTKVLAYFGAGLDISVIKIFADFDIVFVDSQPYSEFNYIYHKEFYRERFVVRLKEAYSEVGYVLEREQKLELFDKTEYIAVEGSSDIAYFDPTLLIFRNEESGRESRYYISSGFPGRLSGELMGDLADCCGLVVSGFFPVSSVRKYLGNGEGIEGESCLRFYCSTNSCYFKQSTEEIADEGYGEPHIVHQLFIDGDESGYKFFAYSIEEQIIIGCDNMNEVADVSVSYLEK